MRKVAVVSAGLVLALLAGCGGSEHSKVSDGSGVDRGSASVAAPALREGAPARPKQQNSDSVDSTAERREVVTGSVDITTDDPIAAAGKVDERVRAVRGRVDSRSEQPDTDTTKPHAALTVRIPADQTDGFITGLRDVGEVTDVTTQREDVTMQWQDLDARIRALQASVDRLRALIAGAATTADLIAAENALSSRQGELDSLTARKRQLDDQISLSTLTIDLGTDEPPRSRPDNYWNRIVDGWHSLLSALRATGNAIPWLGFLLVIAALVWGAVRIRRSGKQNAVPEPEPVSVSVSVSAKDTAAEEVSSSSGGREESGGAGAADGGSGRDQAEQ
ncbi:DUF4349 domain-containing protein [Nocardia sp. BMG51109]|uniref:DUF4349 domain-containing protein n=1 Tax=Nocardia sp. BMG51109 TaxID=1056816 RepID=UPI0004652FBE|nr:DUF4349 domain-containing protein [Nocardia sp. BMG51109]